MPTGAQLIVDLLEEHGVEVCFGLPGVHNLALWEALRDSPIRLIGVRHEQAAAYAADGYARATGKLGVAITTTGPGAANTLGAVGEAWAARSPVLVIATDIPSTLRRPGTYRGVLHETTDQGAMFAPVVKGVHRAHAPSDVQVRLDRHVGRADAAVPPRLPRGRHRSARPPGPNGDSVGPRPVVGAVAAARRRRRPRWPPPSGR